MCEHKIQASPHKNGLYSKLEQKKYLLWKRGGHIFKKKCQVKSNFFLDLRMIKTGIRSLRRGLRVARQIKERMERLWTTQKFHGVCRTHIALHLSFLSFSRGCCHLCNPPSLPRARWDPVEHLAYLQPHHSPAAWEMCSSPWWWCCSSLCQQADLTDSDLSYPNTELMNSWQGSLEQTPSVTAQGINFASELNIITAPISILCTRIRWYVIIRWRFQVSRIILPQLLVRLWPFTI